MKDGHKLLLKYGITTGVAGLFSLGFMWARGLWTVQTPVERYKILADAFSVPGMLLVLFGALLWVSSEGIFDGIGYALNRVGSMFIPMHKKSAQHLTYYDYVMGKRGKRVHGFSFMFFVGLVFIAVSIVFIVLHESVYVPL